MMIFLITTASWARVSVMFHPYDPTLETIANHMKQATDSIDMALYNIDATANNPVIELLNSEEMQRKLKTKKLKVRLIFEGYESKEENQQKMADLEKLGIDVRHLASSRKMHHKYAIIDGNSVRPTLITGSANWSLSSRHNYNENILFFEEERGITLAFQREYELLWNNAKEFGKSRFSNYETINTNDKIETGLGVHFNTDNFEIEDGTVSIDSSKEGYSLTREIVEAIDNANKKVEIATTRLKLRPIYEAIVRAAARGVKIQIIVTMGEFEYKNKRDKMTLPACGDPYNKKCSTSKNFWVYLNRDNYPGHENVDVRIKYFHVKMAAYLNKQMHSKYLIVDDVRVLSGSFNWSYSGEYGHIENIVDIDGSHYPEVVSQFNGDFDRLWEKNRHEYQGLIHRLEEAVKTSTKTECDFEPITMDIEQVDYMLETGNRFNKALSKVCE